MQKIYFFAFAFTLASATFFAQSQPNFEHQSPGVKIENKPKYPPVNKDEADGKHDVTKLNIFRLTAPANADRAAAEERNGNKEGGDTFIFGGISWKVSDACMVFFNALLVLFTLLLWRSTEKLWGEAKSSGKTAEKAANAARDAADIAKMTMLTMQDSAVKKLRAYVHVRVTADLPINLPSNDRINDAQWDVLNYDFFTIVISIKNAGQTPAHNISNFVRVAVKDIESHSFEVGELVADGNSLAGLNQGGIDLKIDFRPLNNELRKKIISGKMALFVWGKIGYTDIYGVNRSNSFRVKLIKTMTGCWDILAFCDKGNEAD